MEDIYKLPASSYEELIKIIRAYGSGKVGVPVSLEDLIKTSGMGRTVLSKNNAFLMQTGLVTKGNNKSPTDMCKKLANSYNMKMNDQVEALWREILRDDEFITKMTSMVRIKGEVSKSDFVKHIVYAANGGNGNTQKAGASALIEIMKITHVIAEKDGVIMIDTGCNMTATPEQTSTDNPSDQQLLVSGDESTRTSFYVQQYTCESGQIAKFIIPDNATEDDLLGFRDMLDISLKRKFKIKIND